MRWYDRLLIVGLGVTCGVLVVVFTRFAHEVSDGLDTTPVTIVETPTTIEPPVACFDTYDLTRERCA